MHEAPGLNPRHHRKIKLDWNSITSVFLAIQQKKGNERLDAELPATCKSRSPSTWERVRRNSRPRAQATLNSGARHLEGQLALSPAFLALCSFALKFTWNLSQSLKTNLLYAESDNECPRLKGDLGEVYVCKTVLKTRLPGCDGWVQALHLQSSVSSSPSYLHHLKSLRLLSTERHLT